MSRDRFLACIRWCVAVRLPSESQERSLGRQDSVGGVDPAMIQVCFYRPESYAAFDPGHGGTFGGADVRAVLLASGLADRPGFQVRFVVADTGQPARQKFGNVEVVADDAPAAAYVRRVRRASEGFRRAFVGGKLRWAGLRPTLVGQVPLLVWHRLAGETWLMNRRAKPCREFVQSSHVVCCFGATSEAAGIVASCRRFGSRSVIFVTGDSQLACGADDDSKERNYSSQEGRLIAEALSTADCIVLQTEDQALILRERFGRAGVVLRNPVVIPAEPLPAEGRYVLWIGRADLTHKRSDLLLELARRCPQIPFRAVMGSWQPGVLEAHLAKLPPNLHLIERATPDEVLTLIRQAAMLVNTSASEGFPNAFLQAAVQEVPILSLKVDPDGFLTQRGAGIVCRDDLPSLATAVAKLWEDPARRALLGKQGRRAAIEQHRLEDRIDDLAELLRNVHAADADNRGFGPFQSPETNGDTGATSSPVNHVFNSSPRPLVSVVVRTISGRSHFLRECLYSVAAQTYRPLEVVVVEDGTAQMQAVIAEFEGLGLDIRYQSTSRVGRCEAGNLGLRLARGTWLNLLDDDDQLFPNHVEALLTAATEDPELSAAFGRSEEVATQVLSSDPWRYRETRRSIAPGRAFPRWALWLYNQFPIQACLFHRCLFEQFGGLDPNLDRLEDWNLWIRYFSDRPVRFVDEVTSFFRVPADDTLVARRRREHRDYLPAFQAKLHELPVRLTARELREIQQGAYRQLLSPEGLRLWQWFAKGSLGSRSLLRGLRLVRAVQEFRRGQYTRTRTAGRVAECLDRLQNCPTDETFDLNIAEAVDLLRALWRRQPVDPIDVWLLQEALADGSWGWIGKAVAGRCQPANVPARSVDQACRDSTPTTSG